MPRLIRPTTEAENETPAPLTDTMRETLDRVMGPAPEGKVFEMPAGFEEKRQRELEKMGLGNGAASITAADIESRNQAIVKDAWQPDLSLTASMGLQGKTALEIAAELGKKPISDEAALATVVDINNRLEAYFVNEPEIPFVAEEETPDPHRVPLAEQRTEEEEAAQGVGEGLGDFPTDVGVNRGVSVPSPSWDQVPHASGGDEREGPQSLLQQVVRPVIEGRPWSEWPDPTTVTASMHHFSVTAESNALVLVLQPENPLATVTAEALAALGRRCAFPPEFVAKLPAWIAAEVVNDRISVAENHDMTVLLQDGQWTAILPAWRGVVPFRVVCDTVYDTLAEHYTDLEVERLETNGMLHFRLLTPVVYPVTGEEDTLQMGVDLTFSYNTTLTVSLLVKRQDGAEMTAYPQSFSWRQRTGDGGSAERQVEWLQQTVLYAIGMFLNFVTKAGKSAEAPVIASFISRSLEFLSPGVVKKYTIPLEAAGGLEPDTVWGTVAAMARFAEGYLEGKTELQAALGAYIANWGE